MKNLFCCLILFLVISLGTGEECFSEEVISEKTEQGVSYAMWNVNVPRPAPVVFVFSTTKEESLGNPYYRQCLNHLAPHGFLGVSVDLPYHGEFRKPGVPDGLSGWAYSCQENQDFLQDVLERLSHVLDHLIEKKIVDPERIAACGTSRGGYTALQWTANDPRVACVAAYAPVTELVALREFKGLENNSLVTKLSLSQSVSMFKERPVWIIIGDRDERVSTDFCVTFARSVSKSSLEKGLNPRVEIHVVPEPKGHTTPAGAPEKSARWILSQLKKEE